jgi:hypothetical protein
MDAWVMVKSWTSQICIGYEVKVYRGDFLQDNKWHNYLPYCNEFYFACPWGLIQPDELPPEAGLLWRSKTGTRLYSKKKSPRRTNDIPSSIFRSVIASRAVITEHERVVLDKVSKYKEWLKDRNERTKVGLMVARRISEMVRNMVGDTLKENRRLADRIEVFEVIERLCRDLGIDPDKESSYTIKRKLNKGLATDDIYNLKVEVRHLMRHLEQIEKAVN